MAGASRGGAPGDPSASCPLGTPISSAGRYDEAAAVLEGGAQGPRGTLGPGHPDSLSTRGLLARTYESLDRWPAAEALWRRTWPSAARKRSQEARCWASTSAPWGENLMKQGRDAEAEPILRERLAAREKSTPDDYRRNRDEHARRVARPPGQVCRGRAARDRRLRGDETREAKISPPLRFHLSEGAGRVLQLVPGVGQAREGNGAWAERLGLRRPAHQSSSPGREPADASRVGTVGNASIIDGRGPRPAVRRTSSAWFTVEACRMGARNSPRGADVRGRARQAPGRHGGAVPGRIHVKGTLWRRTVVARDPVKATSSGEQDDRGVHMQASRTWPGLVEIDKTAGMAEGRRHMSPSRLTTGLEDAIPWFGALSSHYGRRGRGPRTVRGVETWPRSKPDDVSIGKFDIL